MRAAVTWSLFVVSTTACGSSSGQPDATTGHDAPSVVDASDDGNLVDGPTTDAPGDAPIALDGMTPSTQVLRINEVNANASNCDLVELRAIAGGDLTGLRLLERKDIVFTFPAMTVAPGALIVVHFGAAGPCSSGISADETTSATEFPHATYATNYDGAYDLFSADPGLASTDNVISVMRTTTVIDAVLLSDAPTGVAA
ncbi:MAG: hypothetical protein NT062_13785, partial [Proteobacteria bacterium]|nr:hypothetical protein [Pseudomonadota bacterium]